MTQSKFSYNGLDKVIHERARLGILTSLVTHHQGLSFIQLKNLCSLTDGNLSRHIKVLSEAGFVSIEKGQSAFATYIEVLEGIVKDASSLTANAPNLKTT